MASIISCAVAVFFLLSVVTVNAGARIERSPPGGPHPPGRPGPVNHGPVFNQRGPGPVAQRGLSSGGSISISKSVSITSGGSSKSSATSGSRGGAGGSSQSSSSSLARGGLGGSSASSNAASGGRRY